VPGDKSQVKQESGKIGVIQKWAKAMKIEDGLVVLLDFQLSDGEGTLIDESPADEPLAYMHGEAGIVPALESELQGMSEGEAFDITIEPEDAYGEYRPEAVTKVPRASIPADWNLEIGLQVEDSTGETPPQMVTGITQEHVTLDANHVLAGLTLRFRGTVREVREATAEERESGENL
jgi:FKBP-type peptidyl-prolyl cis-trans isomerase SlyD